jgi:transposase-like protein
MEEARYPRLVAWAEETIEETFTFYRLPRQHHKNLKSTNMLERLNEEIRRRTYVVRIFPNAAHAAGRYGHWQSRRTRTGSRHTIISTRTI